MLKVGLQLRDSSSNTAVSGAYEFHKLKKEASLEVDPYGRDGYYQTFLLMALNFRDVAEWENM